MVTVSATQREMLHKAVDELPAESLVELAKFVDYLRYKEEHDMDWFEKIYDLFAPVREAVEQSGMTEEEVDQVIDQAITEVRHERKTQGSH